MLFTVHLMLSTPFILSYLHSLHVMCPFSENASLVTSLQDELNNLKEEMAQLKNTQVSLNVVHDCVTGADLQNKTSQ